MIIAYLGLRQIIRQDVDDYFVSLGLVTYHLIGKQIGSQTITAAILSGINKLIKGRYIISNEKDKDRRNNDWVLNLKPLQIDKLKGKEVKEFYTSVDSDCIVKILNSDIKEKLNMLRFYCYLMTSLIKTGDKKGVGFISYENMAKSTIACRQSISKYMNKLEEKKLIYIFRSNDCIIDYNGIREIPNTYGEFSNMDVILSVGMDYVNSFGENAKHVRSSRKSSTRSASAKYNIIKNDFQSTGEIRYKPEEMKEIYDILVDYNKRYKDEGKELKDLSIFSNYDFYKGE